MFTKSFDLLCAIIVVLVYLINDLTSERCDRTLSYREHKSTADGRYRIEILGEPRGYIPGNTYSGIFFLTFV